MPKGILERLAEGPVLLAYRGEREMVAKAVEMLANDPL